MKKIWTEKLDARLRELWPRHKSLEVARLMGMSKIAVQSRAKRLELNKDHDFRGLWSKEEEQFLRTHYPDLSNAELARLLGRRESQIKSKSDRMRLNKSKQYISAVNKAPNAGKFGHRPPWNKGMKGVFFGSTFGQFRPKNKPHNDKGDGALSIRWEKDTGRPIIIYRVSAKKWIPYAHHVFASYYGEVPKGMIVRFRNGNRLDFRLENLELLSKRANYLRNSCSVQLTDGFVVSTMLGKGSFEGRDEIKKALLEHPELIKTKRSIIQIKRLCQPK